jgi:hypothetical protein
VFWEKFSNNEKTVEITFNRSSIDATSLAIDVPLNASILYASVDVSSDLNKNKYPTDVTVNVGNDADNEWEFRGKGYGSFGKQTLFNDGSEKSFLYFQNTSFRNDAKILLPRNASVSQSSMTLEGGTGSYDEEYFVSVDQYGYNLNYYKSNGDGSWGSAQLISSSAGRYLWGAVGMADFDNDGDLDVVAGGTSGNIYFYEKTAPECSFATPVNIGSITTTSYVYDYACGDFNNDGNYDFICSGDGSAIFLFTGDGKGGFTMSTIAATGAPSRVYGKDAADFNRDGNLDFVCGGSTSYNVFYYQGNGDGTFQNAVRVSCPSVAYAYSVITDDFNNDKKPDILAAYYYGELYYLEGNGDGTFKSNVYSGADAGYFSGGDGWDYDNDGNVDIVIIDRQYEWPPTYPGSTAKFYSGDGDGTFTYKTSLSGSAGSYSFGGAAPPPKVSGANNTKLFIGDLPNTQHDWEFPGRLEGMQSHVEDGTMTPKLNDILTKHASKFKIHRDRWNNEFLIIPLNFTSTHDGLVRVSKFFIEYDLTATIYKTETGTLADELNEHIVFTEEDFVRLHFIVSSSTAGKLTFSNLQIIYNIPPDRKDDIPTLHAYEDIENLNLLTLSDYFTDTDQSPTKLNYSVVQNTQNEYVDVYTNYTNILKFTPILPNWHGETDIMVEAVDSGMKKSYSNEFKIIIHPVNDEPTPELEIPDVKIVEGEQERKLDLELREYFSDVEDDLLYYKVEIDPKSKMKTKDEKNITVIKNDDNILEISAVGDFNTYMTGQDDPIPIWIYCDDDSEVNTLKEGNYTHQEIFVSVLPVNDPPAWEAIPPIVVYEDNIDSYSDCLDIFHYLDDDENADSEIELDFIGSNPTISLYIANGNLSIEAPENYYGSTMVSIVAKDRMGAKSSTNFELFIRSVNDPPVVVITSHTHLQRVEDTINLGGTIFDVEDTVDLVEVKIESMDLYSPNAESFDWQRASIDFSVNNWTYVWDTTMVPDGEYKITARAWDGELDDEEYVALQIKNDLNFEPQVDIVYPDEDETINGTVIITGTVSDPDYQGIHDLQIRVGVDMDWTEIPLKSENETVWSFTWDSTTVSDGEISIYAKAFDGISWSMPASRTIYVENGITGIQDKTEATDEGDVDNTVWLISILLIVVIVVLSLIIIASIVRRGKSKVNEYVPDGRMEPLDELERAVTPALAPGAAAVQPGLPSAPAPAPAATLPPAAVPGTGAPAATQPALPPPTPQAPSSTPTPTATPAQVQVQAPALPPHTAPTPTPTPTTTSDQTKAKTQDNTQTQPKVQD